MLKKKFFLLMITLFFVNCINDAGYKKTNMNKTFKINYASHKFLNKNKKIKKIIISSNEAIKNFNPYYSSSKTDDFLINAVYSSLFTINCESGYPEKNLIENYEIAEDSLTYKFVLKNNIKFSNGELLTTNDVEANLNLLNAVFKNSILYKNFFINNEKLTFIKINNLEFNIILDKPNANLIYALCAFPILYRKQIEEYINNPNNDKNNFYIENLKNITGSGPFLIKEINDEKIIFYKNIYYFKKDIKGNNYPYTEIIELKLYQDINEEITDYINNKIDIIYISDNDFINIYNYYQNNFFNKVRFIKTENNNNLFLLFNTSDTRRFKNLNTRIIFSDILITLFKNTDLKTKINKNKIKRFLKISKFNVKNLTVLLCEQNTELIKLIEPLKNIFAKEDIILNIKIEPYQSFIENINNNNHYDLVLFYFKINNNPVDLINFFQNKNIYTLTNEKNNEALLTFINGLINELINETNLSKQKIIINKIFSELNEQRLLIPLYKDKTYFAINSNLYNFKVNDNSEYFYNLKTFETMFKY